MPEPDTDDRSLGQLLRELSNQTTSLFRQEIDLAKTELSEKASRVGSNVGSIAFGGAVTFAGALALLAAAVLVLHSLLNDVLSPDLALWLSPLIVGAVLAGIGYGMMSKAIHNLKQEGLTPHQTTRTLEENTQWIKAKIRS